MNNAIKIFFISIFISFLVPFANAQQMSFDTKTVDGVEYYVYHVVSGEGLYSISKKFAVSQSEINKANPKIQNGLKAGETILIPVSKSKVNVKRVAQQSVDPNVEFVLHTVERRQTLFAISRKYKVSEDAIIAANPELKNRRIQKGEVLRIPVVKEAKGSVEQNENKVGTADNAQKRTVRNGYIIHKVVAKETLYAISNQYDVSVDDIIQVNPELKKRNIQIGEELNIPVVKKKISFWEKVVSIFKPNSTDTKKTNPSETEVQTKNTNQTNQTLHIGKDNTYFTHEVAPQETLYAISRKYNVKPSEIKSLNPNLEVNNIAIGTVLKIPYSNKGSNTQNQIAESSASTAKVVEQKKTVDKTYKIAYLLPFMSNDVAIDPTVEKFIEFYFGSLLAINNVKNDGINFEVYTFDTEKTEKKIYEIINQSDIQDVDMIIGPAYSSQIPIMADFAKRRKIPTIIPFSSKAEFISSNPYLFQFNPDQSIQNDAISQVVTNRYKNANIIFVENGERASESGYYEFLINVLNKKQIKFNRVSTAEMANIENHLSSDKKNLFIYQSDEYKKAKSDLEKLNGLTNYDITVLGQYSWRSESGKKPNMIYIAPFKGNASSTQYYDNEYKKYYGKVAHDVNPRWDLLGYDLTSYFLSTIKKDGFIFSHKTQTLTFKNGVQSDFKFIRENNNGGFVNHQLFLIEDAAN